LNARRDIGRFAEHFAARLDHDRSRLESDARGELRRAFGRVPGIHLAESALDRERRPHGALGVVLLRPRIPEDGHQPIAKHLKHVAAELEIRVDEVAPVFGVELRGEARRPGEVAKHHRDRPPFGLGA
jgi:hypothetical protein